MNKYLVFYFIALLLYGHTIALQAQSLSPVVIASGGSTYTAGGYSLDFTVGETLTATLSGGSNIVTQGFHQPSSAATTCAVKIWLEGPFNGSAMTNTLQTGNVLPTAQPFNNSPWFYAGTESVTTFPGNVTDWVLLELRTTISGGYTGNNLVAQRAALLYTDGTIHDTNGNAYVTFNNVATGNYYIAVKPRGNLAVMSANAVTLPNNASPYNFTNAINMALGPNQQQLVSGQACLRVGDFDNNGVINVSDFNLLQTHLIGGVNVYRTSDANKDRQVTTADFNLYRPNASSIGMFAIRY